MTRTPAVAYSSSGPPEVFEDVEIDVPDPGDHDLLVEVRAVSVNPVDVKSRSGRDPQGTPKVLGYDAAGVVVAVGAEVDRFTPGDEVFYAGSIDRPGTNAGHHLVDQRIVGHKPRSVDFADAAALPLTSITAWESLFDHLELTADTIGSILIIGAAGGVGSMVVQLAAQLTSLAVIGTASRRESADWATRLGVHDIIDRHQLAESVRAVAPDGVDYIFSPFSAGNIERYAEVLKPRGHVVAIDEPEGLDLVPLKAKSVSWHWEYMFTRPLYEPDDLYQGALLERVSGLVDSGQLVSTRTVTLEGLNAATLAEAHRRVEGSSAIGKVVVTF
jgi:NADPH2:quinone reductase